MFELIKREIRKWKDFKQRIRDDEDETYREVDMHIKRTCPLPKCLASPLDDPSGFNCQRCIRLRTNAADLVRMRSDMLQAKTKRAVHQYIREKCNNPLCTNASNKDASAYTCNNCLRLRSGYEFAKMAGELEKNEDAATMKIIRSYVGCGEECTGKKYNYKCRACRPCKCKTADFLDPVTHGKGCVRASYIYSDARRKMLLSRAEEFERSKILAFIRSSCSNELCKEASKVKISAFSEQTRPSGPACERCESLFGGGEKGNHRFEASKMAWEEEVGMMGRVKEFMMGKCGSPACFFSVTGGGERDGGDPIYCQRCWDALEFDCDRVKRKMLKREREGREEPVVGISLRGKGKGVQMVEGGVGGRGGGDPAAAVVKGRANPGAGAGSARRERYEDLFSGDDSLVLEGYSPIDD